MDYMATLADLANLSLPGDTVNDGMSLRDAITNPDDDTVLRWSGAATFFFTLKARRLEYLAWKISLGDINHSYIEFSDNTTQHSFS